MKLAPAPLRMMFAATVVMFAPSDIVLLASTSHVAPVSLPDARLVGGGLIDRVPPPVALTAPEKVPPPVRLRVPDCTAVVPAPTWLNATPMVLVPDPPVLARSPRWRRCRRRASPRWRRPTRRW